MLQLVLVLLLIACNALFSLAEYALITVRSSRIRQLVEEGNKNAAMVEETTAAVHSLKGEIDGLNNSIGAFNITGGSIGRESSRVQAPMKRRVLA